MIWVLAAIVVFAIYNAEKLPDIIGKMKNEVPNIVEAGKKASKELKEKAQEVQKKAEAKKKNSETKEDK